MILKYNNIQQYASDKSAWATISPLEQKNRIVKENHFISASVSRCGSGLNLISYYVVTFCVRFHAYITASDGEHIFVKYKQNRDGECHLHKSYNSSKWWITIIKKKQQQQQQKTRRVFPWHFIPLHSFYSDFTRCTVLNCNIIIRRYVWSLRWDEL